MRWMTPNITFFVTLKACIAVESYDPFHIESDFVKIEMFKWYKLLATEVVSM